jgi:hypothetical protein
LNSYFHIKFFYFTQRRSGAAFCWFGVIRKDAATIFPAKLQRRNVIQQTAGYQISRCDAATLRENNRGGAKMQRNT